MLTEICAELRNYFEVPNGRYFGKFTISGGSIAPSDFLQEGQYFRIVGSTFNDGVYKGNGNIVDPTLNIHHDEVFEGAVWAMAVPPSIIALAAEIAEYQKSDASKPTGFASESFGGYSYSKFTDGNGGDGSRWQNVFKDRLRKWRKL